MEGNLSCKVPQESCSSVSVECINEIMLLSRGGRTDANPWEEATGSIMEAIALLTTGVAKNICNRMLQMDKNMHFFHN